MRPITEYELRNLATWQELLPKLRQKSGAGPPWSQDRDVHCTGTATTARGSPQSLEEPRDRPSRPLSVYGAAVKFVVLTSLNVLTVPLMSTTPTSEIA